MNKTLPLCLLTLISSHVAAGTMGPIKTPNPFNGVYAGFGVGGSFGAFETAVDTFAPPPDPPFMSELHGLYRTNDPTAIGTTLLGYGLAWDNFYVGAELFGNLGRLKSKSRVVSGGTNPVESISTTTSAQLNQGEFGVDGRLGWLPMPRTLIYGRLGVGFNKIQINSASTIFSDATEPLRTVLMNYEVSKSKGAFRAGGGLEQMITDALSVRMDYIYENYGTLTGAISTTDAVLGPMSNATRVKFETHSILATASWHFNS